MTSTQPDPQALRVAVIDDDSGFVHVLARRMEALGWQFRVTGGSLPVESLVAMRLNAIVVDLALLGPTAWDYLQDLCERLPGLPVIVCTANASVAQRVRGLRAGADDWVNKPCHPEELIARIEAVSRRRRRGEAPAAGGPIVAGGIEIRADQFQAFSGGRSLDLTRREFELIHLLACAEGQVLPREDIYQRVWGYAMAHGDRSVDVFVRKLRQKLERGSPGWRYIHTHFGVGYRFAAERVGGEPEAAGGLPDASSADADEGEPAAARAPSMLATL